LADRHLKSKLSRRGFIFFSMLCAGRAECQRPAKAELLLDRILLWNNRLIAFIGIANLAVSTLIARLLMAKAFAS
jgi:hypothetical protein